MVAQATPARANIMYISHAGLPARMKDATVKAVASMTMPPKMVFFLPILEATIPAGR